MRVPPGLSGSSSGISRFAKSENETAPLGAPAHTVRWGMTRGQTAADCLWFGQGAKPHHCHSLSNNLSSPPTTWNVRCEGGPAGGAGQYPAWGPEPREWDGVP